MFVLTIDQIASRRAADLIPQLLTTLHDAPTVRGFERTIGDEAQGVLGDPAEVVRIVLALLRQGEWSVGIGAGEVDDPLPDSTRAARGPAFVFARKAVEEAKKRTAPSPVAVIGTDPTAAGDAQAVLRLLAGIRAGRSEKGWEVADLLAAGLSQAAIANNWA